MKTPVVGRFVPWNSKLLSLSAGRLLQYRLVKGSRRPARVFNIGFVASLRRQKDFIPTICLEPGDYWGRAFGKKVGLVWKRARPGRQYWLFMVLGCPAWIKAPIRKRLAASYTDICPDTNTVLWMRSISCIRIRLQVWLVGTSLNHPVFGNLCYMSCNQQAVVPFLS